MTEAGSRSFPLGALGAVLAMWAVVCLAVPQLEDSVRLAMWSSALVVSVGIGLAWGRRDLAPMAKRRSQPPPPTEPDATDESQQAPKMAEVPRRAEPKGATRPAASVSPPPAMPRLEAPVAVGAPVAPGGVSYGSGVTGAWSKWLLHFQVDDVVGILPLPVQRDTIRVGRGANNDLIVAHAEVGTNDHIHLLVRDEGFFVVDVGFHLGAGNQRVEGSRNGTAVIYDDGPRAILPRQIYPWPLGAAMVIPAASVVAGGPTPPTKVTLRLLPKGDT